MRARVISLFTLLAAIPLLAGLPATGAPASEAVQTHHVVLHIESDAPEQPIEVVLSVAGDEAVDVAETPVAAEKTRPAEAAAEEAVANEGAGHAAPGSSMGLLFFVFVLAIFLGFELIAKVPSQLHTPLMSGSNAISGITIVGALIAAGTGHKTFTVVLGTLAVACAMINVVGGYLVTDRMLAMFKHKDGGAS